MLIFLWVTECHSTPNERGSELDNIEPQNLRDWVNDLKIKGKMQ